MSNANDNGSGNAATPEEEEDDGEIQMEEVSPNELFRLDVEPAANSEENSVEIDAEGEGDGDGDGEDDDDVAPEDDSNGDDAANADADDDPAADRRSAAKKELTQIIDKWEQEQTQSGYDPVPTIRR